MIESKTWHRILSSEDSEFDNLSSTLVSPMIVGIGMLSACMVFFALVIHFEWIEDLAPRVANRPKAVIKNAITHNIAEKYKNKIYIYPIAWILWAYHLTYKQCIIGIPGTGTRKKGWEGPLLKLNLDAVVLLKFNTLLFKISLLAAFLCVFILIPINLTADCEDAVLGIGTCDKHKKKYWIRIGNILKHTNEDHQQQH